jgi:hypothetical protein
MCADVRARAYRIHQETRGIEAQWQMMPRRFPSRGKSNKPIEIEAQENEQGGEADGVVRGHPGNSGWPS